MLQSISFVVVSALLGLSSACFGNDSIGRVDAGGVTMLTTNDIEMKKEALEISEKLVRVSYVFRNHSPREVGATVVFPFPIYSWDAGESASGLNNRRLNGFRLTIDGAEKPAKVDRRAILNGKDITDSLKKIGLTGDQIFLTFGDYNINRGCALRPQQCDALYKLHGVPGDAQYTPGWHIREVAFWEQIFPASASITVQHEYVPFAGGTYSYPYWEGQSTEQGDGIPESALSQGSESSTSEACLDEGSRKEIFRRVNQLRAAGYPTIKVDLRDVEYILGTGNNWRGPISEFQLRIHKNSPDQVVSLCFPGKAKRTSPTTIDFHHKDFIPQDKLVVHFYTITGEAAAK